MIEIKFRAKLDKESFPKSYKKDWVYGFVSKHEDEWCIDTFGNDGRFVSNGQYLKINGETIGQFTGHKDKSGVEIYSGHIYDIGMCTKVIRPEHFIEDTYELMELLKDNATVEIIGDIYEYPELLEAAE